MKRNTGQISAREAFSYIDSDLPWNAVSIHGPDYFRACEKVTHSSQLRPSSRRARTPEISSLVGEPYGRVRDYQQPPWQQTLPKGRRSSRLGLPSRLQVIAADCNPGKPHPALSQTKNSTLRVNGREVRYMHDPPCVSGWESRVESPSSRPNRSKSGLSCFTFVRII